jgi:cyclic pyranopterin phosphate synthase
MLQDNFNRIHDYLRISLTDVCNFRCQYCIPDEDAQFMPNSHLMQLDEIVGIATQFVNLGIKKIRLTGGEPLARKDAADIIHALSKLPVKLTITTNGSRIHEFIDVFKAAKMRSINVSLDTLDSTKFHQITKRNQYTQVINNINLLINHGFHVKLNMVVMRGFNDNEILNFIDWTKDLPIHVRFIEFMPFTGNQWDNEKVFTFQEILTLASSKYQYAKLREEPNETAKSFQVNGYQGTFAVISTMTAPFCHTCNRLRLTADGKMKNCLFSKGEVGLLEALRAGENLTPLIKLCLNNKAKALGGQFEGDYHQIDPQAISNRSMIKIGG